KKPFNIFIDKRKYSAIMRWVERKLEAIDVDKYFAWINEMDQKVITDAVTPDEEKFLLKRISGYEHPIHNFMKFYEMAVNFRHYLLIRLRYDAYETVNEFLHQYEVQYEYSKEVNRKLHEATVKVIDQFNHRTRPSEDIEKFLTDLFYNDQLDGFNRYMAVVRLTFYYFNNQEYEKLRIVYDHLDSMLIEGKFYTRRILYNYYANRLMLHAKFDVLQQAEEYGYLSIRQKNADHIQYLSNFSSILIKRGKVDEALKLLQNSFSEIRNIDNFYHKISFVSFYIKCLNLNKQPERGEFIAESFLRTNCSEILEQRWYTFFSGYLQSLILLKNYSKVLQVFEKYDLLSKDTAASRRDKYLPTIRWYYEIARLKTNRINAETMFDSLVRLSVEYFKDPSKSIVLQQVLNELEGYIPRTVTMARAQLHKQKAIQPS
ncbi:MAG: hypothetical protein P8X57_13315, partial [Cyclobacteriaceae bacterium]